MNYNLIINIIAPTIISAYCFAFVSIALLRIKNKRKHLENLMIVLMSISVALWAFTPTLYKINWIYGKIAGLAVFTTCICYVYAIIKTKFKKLCITALSGSSIILISLLFIPGMKIKIYSAAVYILIYPHAFIAFYFLFKYYFAHRIGALIKIFVMGCIMFLAGFYDSIRVLYGLIFIPVSLVGSFVYIATVGYFLLYRGYLKKEDWSDYLIEVNEKEKLLEEKYILLKKANINSIIILTQTIEAKDPYTRGHCLRVRDFSKAIAEVMGFNKEKLLFLEFGALLHDIGKILIPGKILNKKEKLSEKEFSIIKRHPEIGADFLKNVEYFAPIIPMIRNHHEHFNGTGYPDKLSEKNIPLEARILAVSDAFDAMTSDRPYRKALNYLDAIGVLKDVAGTQLDPNIVKIFLDNKLYFTQHDLSDKIFFDYQLN